MGQQVLVGCWRRGCDHLAGGASGRNGERGKGADEQDAEADQEHQLQHTGARHIISSAQAGFHSAVPLMHREQRVCVRVSPET